MPGSRRSCTKLPAARTTRCTRRHAPSRPAAAGCLRGASGAPRLTDRAPGGAATPADDRFWGASGAVSPSTRRSAPSWPIARDWFEGASGGAVSGSARGPAPSWPAARDRIEGASGGAVSGSARGPAPSWPAARDWFEGASGGAVSGSARGPAPSWSVARDRIEGASGGAVSGSARGPAPSWPAARDWFEGASGTVSRLADGAVGEPSPRVGNRTVARASGSSAVVGGRCAGGVHCARGVRGADDRPAGRAPAGAADEGQPVVACEGFARSPAAAGVPTAAAGWRQGVCRSPSSSRSRRSQ